MFISCIYQSDNDTCVFLTFAALPDNLKNIFVSPYPTLYYKYWLVDRIFFFLLLKFDTH